MPKTNIPMGLGSGEKDYTDEMKYLSSLIYNPNRTTTGQETYTSATSGTTYSTEDYPNDADIYNKGDVGIIRILWNLYGGEDGFLVLADDANSYIRPQGIEMFVGDPIETTLIDGNLKAYYPRTDTSQVIDAITGRTLYNQTRLGGIVYDFSNHGANNRTPRYAKIADFKLASNNTSANAKLYLNGFSGKWAPSRSVMWNICFANRDGFSANPLVCGSRYDLGMDIKVYKHTNTTLSIYVTTLESTYCAANFVARTTGNTTELVLQNNLVWSETVPDGDMIWSLVTNGYAANITAQNISFLKTNGDKISLSGNPESHTLNVGFENSSGSVTENAIIRGVANPTQANDAMNKSYADNNYYRLNTWNTTALRTGSGNSWGIKFVTSGSGTSMQGNINIMGRQGSITENPYFAIDGFKGTTVDSGSRIDVRVNGVATPTANNDAANKKYVDDKISSSIVKSATAPSNTSALWLDTSTGMLKYHNGSAWVGVVGVWG